MPKLPSHPVFVSSKVVSKLVQIREYISKVSSMRDDLVEKNDVPANVERLSHLIDHLKEQEKSYLRFLQKMLVSRMLSVLLLSSMMLIPLYLTRLYSFTKMYFHLYLFLLTWHIVVIRCLIIMTPLSTCIMHF